MSLVCKGQAERRINIRGGLFILTLPTACRINGRGWTMTGIARRSAQMTVSLPVVAIKHFRLSTTITQRSVERHLNSPHWEILSKIENIKISSLDVDPNEDSGIIWGLNTHSTIWTTIGILILVTGIILMIVMSFQKSDPECVPGCTFELLDRYDDSERRASTGRIPTVRDVRGKLRSRRVRAKRTKSTMVARKRYTKSLGYRFPPGCRTMGSRDDRSSGTVNTEQRHERQYITHNSLLSRCRRTLTLWTLNNSLPQNITSPRNIKRTLTLWTLKQLITTNFERLTLDNRNN